MKKFITVGLIISGMLMSACGTENTPSSDPKLAGGPVAAAIAINVVSGAIVELLAAIGKGGDEPAVPDSSLKPTKIGEALPKAKANELKGGERKSTEIKTHYKDDIYMKYRIEYVYGIKFNGKGAYIKDVVFIPMEANIAKGFSLSATSLSQDPETNAEGKTSLRFVITFKVTSPKDGTKITSHRFLISDYDGKIHVVKPELDQGDPRVD